MVLKKEKELAISGKQKGSVREETNAVCGRPTPKTAPSSEPPTQRGGRASRKGSLRGRSQSGKSNRQPEKLLKGTCSKIPCDYWHPPAEFPFKK